VTEVVVGWMFVVAGHVTLTVPRRHTALAGDLLVVFNTSDDTSLNNTDWYIDVIAESRDTGHLSPLTVVDIPSGYSDGEVSVGCGVVDVAGQLVVRLVDSTTSDVVAQSRVVDVEWPSSVTLRLPDSHEALSDDLALTLSVENIACQSQHSHVFYTLQFVYLGVNVSSPHKTVVFQQTLAQLASPPSQIIVPCSLIDRAGSYQAVLTSSRRSAMPVAVSNVVVVAWSHAYSLSSLSLSLSRPCRRPVVVHHTQPRCHAVFYTVRVIVRQLPSNYNRVDGVSDDVTTSRDWRYVAERQVKSSMTSVTFSCTSLLFGGHDDTTTTTTSTEHCVLLISTAMDDSGHVHRRLCATPSTRLHTGTDSA